MATQAMATQAMATQAMATKGTGSARSGRARRALRRANPRGEVRYRLGLLGVGLLITVSLACKRSASLASGIPAPSASEPSGATRMNHDPAHPPIDCPLRKHGVDSGHLRPFEDVERYIAFLERADRAAWQKPDEVVKALGLSGNEVIADIGAGSGYFAFRFARAVPRGRVVAGDVEPEMVRHLHHRSMMEGVSNLAAVFAKPDDPEVPVDADWVFLCDVLHHIADRPAWLAKLASEMKHGSRLAIIEFKEGDLPEGPPASAKIPETELRSLVTNAGLTPEANRADLLPYQTFSIFRKP